MEREVRVRFAPSPTGALHIGGLRTALYNYLLARKHGGKMLLRIEDTDQTRFYPGAEEYIVEALKWIGITIDEGVSAGGPHAPYRQSERKPMYMEYAVKLINDGNAYYAFDTAEELDAMRARLTAAKVPNPQYNSITRATMKNSLTLPEDEVKRRLASGEPYVIRIKIPKKEEVRLNDIIRGWVMVHSSTLDDKVLMKSDGMPTYHMANVVDDYLMGISHVIRGEEWLPSAPLHVLLYRYLGWEDKMPQFAHLPLLLKPDGNGKLSKRDADSHGFPIFPLHWTDPFTGDESKGFRESGYLPEAMINFLALLGWNPGDNREFFTMEELINEFSIERIGKAGAKFDINKAKWFNQHYLRQKSDEELANYLLADLKKAYSNDQIDYDNIYRINEIKRICNLLKERIVFPSDLLNESKYFFHFNSGEIDINNVRIIWSVEMNNIIEEFINLISDNNYNFRSETIKNTINQINQKYNLKLGAIMQTIRLLVTGTTKGPDLMMTLEILTKEVVLQRTRESLKHININLFS